MVPSDEWIIQSVRGELGRRKQHRLPRSWIRRCRSIARERADENLELACDLALRYPHPKYDTALAIARLAGRRC